MTTTALTDQLIGHVRDVADYYDELGQGLSDVRLDLPDGTYEVPPTTVRVCPRGCHLAVAHRWHGECDRCGQTLRTGAVGLATHLGEPPNPCIDGGHDWQHGCGEWNSPTERIIDLATDEVEAELDERVEQARRGALDDADADAGADEAIHAYAEELVRGAIVALHEEIAEDRQTEAERVRQRLLRELNDALLKLRDGADPDDVVTGSELHPGVHRDEAVVGGWVAWDLDPRGEPGDEPIAVTLGDFDLVGVAAVAEITGLSETSIRTYVTRRTIPEPLPVGGSDALVWHREDIERWVATRPGRGRPHRA